MVREFKLADSVAMRCVQIFQEALLLGVDGADLLRQVRLRQSDEDPGVLVLTEAYADQVTKMHAAYEARALELRAMDGRAGSDGSN